ncbi:glycosyltransferase [Synechococcus sp. BSF8S]|uniref:glycosyltransferase family 2 protein n=1 Tax=Synechococcales TaxID=1890424 RepID=UPI00162729C2|nr:MULTISPECIES: glycosyltransferase family 2 protein [unclassified Synechococcus]MBC1262544.1 glycosyltransferase [Synechococcus sp. BSF8S]MBC1265434.1 glycosyltransferase [Synechococcus sp. BSA11S]
MPFAIFADCHPWTIATTKAYEKQHNTTISVIISLYNYDNYILSCIQSVVEAIRFDSSLSIEIMIVNDASSDNSLDIVKSFLDCNQDIALILIDKTSNSGLSHTRNLGIRLARGRSIFILDADNTIEPSCLSKLYHFLEITQAASVYCRIAKYDGETNAFIGYISDQEFSLNRLLRSNYIDAMALFKRSAFFDIGFYDVEMVHGWEDYDVWLSLALSDQKVEYYPETLAYYRVHPDSMLTKLNEHALSISRYLYHKHHLLLPEINPHSILFGHSSQLVIE